MDLLNALRTNQLAQFKQSFSWKAKDGRVMKIEEMDTTHLFNTAKLLLNKFNEAQISRLYVRGPNSYACDVKNGQTVFFFVWEIECRDDLQPRYRTAYQQMLNRVFDQRFLFEELPPAVRLRSATDRMGRLNSTLNQSLTGQVQIPPRPFFSDRTVHIGNMGSPDRREFEREMLGRFDPARPNSEATVVASPPRGRNPLLMVIDEPMAWPPEPAKAKKEEPKQTAAEHVEQLTQIGKRKIQFDGEPNE